MFLFLRGQFVLSQSVVRILYVLDHVASGYHMFATLGWMHAAGQEGCVGFDVGGLASGAAFVGGCLLFEIYLAGINTCVSTS